MHLRVLLANPAFPLFVAPTLPYSLIDLQRQEIAVKRRCKTGFVGSITEACFPGGTQDGEAGGELLA